MNRKPEETRTRPVNREYPDIRERLDNRKRERPEAREQQETRENQAPREPQRPRIGIIADSNGRMISRELQKHHYRKSSEYIPIPDYRTIEDLEKITRHQTTIEEIRTLDQIVIMIGTNNIK